MNERVKANLRVALEAVLANQMRSILTALGIVFGVGAVIAMLAIGNGAQQEIMEQIRLVGVNNIVIEPIVEQVEEALSESAAQEKKKFTPGLTLGDAQAMMEVLPNVQEISPEVLEDTYIISSGIRRSAKLVGVGAAYFDIYNFELQAGNMFNERQLQRGAPVCIIGKAVATRFFAGENPVGKSIKCGKFWFEVVGVLEERYASKKSLEELGIRDVNMDVYVPIETMLLRFRNRALVNETLIARAREDDDEEKQVVTNYHQLDRLVIQVAETDELEATADVVRRMLSRRHFGVVDYQITIPELLLKQQQRTNQIFNIVLGAIAGISLLVGGIGIMNIMLASVLERIKEIGLRLSIGAKKQDIVLQFLFEAILISITGGLLGVLLGVVLAVVISQVAEIPTIISPLSILISFGVAASVGLVFGIAPARRAASQNPITSLRYE